MGYIQIYYKIPAKQAIKGLQRAQEQSEISQETKCRKSVIEHYQRFGLASTLDAYKIKSVQTDNGLEFYKRFDDYLRLEKITHYWNYPRSPKSNAYIECFNRTLREQFFDVYQYDLTDIENVEQDLDDYLNWYNRQKVHQGLNWLTPFDFTRRFLKSVA